MDDQLTDLLSPKNILITGRPGIGKTSFILKLAEQLGTEKTGGFFTREIRKAGLREGFSISTFDRFEKILAHQRLTSTIRVSKYGVDLDALDSVMDHLIHSYSSPAIWLIDEIGKMESFSKKFRDFIEQILDEEKPVIATIALRAGGWIENIKMRPDVRVIEMTQSNRNSLLNQVKTLLTKQ